MQTKGFLARHCYARPRLIISIVASLVVALCLPVGVVSQLTTRLLIAFNVGTCLFLILAGVMMARSSRDTMMQRARLEDEGQWLVLTLVMVAAVASLVGIVAELSAVKGLAGAEKAAHIGLAGLTVVSSWAFTHTMFAMHYAHNYYLFQSGPAKHGGLSFPVTPPSPPGERGKKDQNDNDDTPAQDPQSPPDNTEPDYGDFLYFSLIIGTSAQTADVSFTSKPMRRLGTVHCVLAFLFNTSVLALSINIAASLI